MVPLEGEEASKGWVEKTSNQYFARASSIKMGSKVGKTGMEIKMATC